MLKLTLFKRGISFSWPVVLLGGFLFVLMALAGVWQLERAQQKVAMALDYERVSRLKAISDSALTGEAKELNYRHAVFSGQYLSERQFLLDNRIHTYEGHKRVGYQVLTPFMTDAGRVVLVDRGWQAADVDRRILPDISVSEQKTNIAGVMTLVSDAFKMGSMDSNQQWPRVIAYIDFEGIERHLAKKVYPALLVLNADQSDRYAYNWKAVIKGPWMHYSYAFQWFAMCIMLIIALLVVGFRAGQDIKRV